jgi:hypothetical protein
LREIAHGTVAADLAAVGDLDPGEHAQQRRLAGAVGTDESDPAAGIHAKVDAVEDDARTEVAGDLTGLEQRRRHAGSFRTRGQTEDSRDDRSR